MVNTLEPDVEPIPGYRLKRYIGRGGFGEVWEAEAPGGLSKAIKLAPMERNDSSLNSRELEGLQKMREIRHPYLLSIERFEIAQGFLVIVMELADMNLAQRFSECVAEGHRGIPRDELLVYLREAAEVLDLMNQKYGLQHLDVKPENLFLCSNHIKVADFGLVQPRNTNMTRSALAISPPYAPPELFDGHVEPTADQYSLAVTYQELLTGSRPFSGVDVRALIYQHLRGRANLTALPPTDREIVSQAIQRDAPQRYQSCTDFVHALERVAAFGTPSVEKSAPKDTVVDSGMYDTDEIDLPTPKPIKGRVLEGIERRKIPLSLEEVEATKPNRKLVKYPRLGTEKNSGIIHSAFVAFLPLEIYAHKLRGFIDAMDAEVIDCSQEKTILRFSPRGFLGRRQSKGIFLELDTFCHSLDSGHRVVDVTIWSTRRELQGHQLARRGTLLTQCLRAYLMASEEKGYRILKTDSQILKDVLT